MFNNMKISTSLIGIFIIFTLLQVISSGLGFYRAKDAARDFDEIVSLNTQREYLANAKEALLRARIESNKTVVMTLVYRTDQANELMVSAKEDLDLAQNLFEEFFKLPLTSEKAAELEKPIVTHSQKLIDALRNQLSALEKEGKNGYLTYDVEPIQIQLDDAIATFANHIQNTIELKNTENTHEAKIASIQLIIELIIVFCLVTAVLIWLRQAMTRPLTLLLTHFQHITDGDLTSTIPHLGKNEIGQLFDYFGKMQSSLIHTVGLVRETTHSIVEGIERLASGNDDLSARTEQQASSLEETAASMEEITATVKLNADNAKNASILANNTAHAAQKGGEVSTTVVNTMHDISESSNKIGAITNVIDSIAFQTNILALNAAVEAARAGEQGRGFAVVAGEVRNLAQRSAQAAREIKQLIADALERVELGSQLVTTSGETMQDIVKSANEVNEIIGSISSASDEQSRGIQLVSQAVNEMDNVTQKNSGLVNQLANSTRAIEEQAMSLTKAVATFKLK
ncbi:methyl-accepting chemotaxis protein [Thorsellia anophelis]|uniref:Methyl-accepting chemotaxis sensory transducer with TarH sensor n=1 Tax=Thorsellia anophelis DSM 18579 TaxID=1123402 RepID=A0A1I0C7Y7_9GAMM|nr:methyl-accepting chemotaxis protein [Thorsellia anophelis]SET15663.1 methyl-accepting chemotaxis sensory transducer with TarH sensor [Thorsellia anophelis DSM 18579]